MDVRTCSKQQHKANSATQHRKRKRNHKGVDDASSPVVINNLPDDVLIAILSRMSRKEAARTSVLSRKWRYLWLFTSGTLELDDRSIFSPRTLGIDNCKDKVTKIEIKRRKFIAYVNRVLKLHQGLGLDGLIIRFAHLRGQSPFGLRPGYIDNWIYFAMHKELKMFELIFHPHYEFPNIDMLLSRSNDGKFGFGSLRSLRLVGVDVNDEVVQYFLASCPYLEQLSIRGSSLTKNLQVVDPLPNLKVLEISHCCYIRSLEVSVMNLVSCTYEGHHQIILPFKKIPNLSELTLGGNFARSFIYEPYKHSSYSVQLVKLSLNIPDRVLLLGYSKPDFHLRDDHPALPRLRSLKHLELNVRSPVGRSIHFLTSFVKASPLLNEFMIKISSMLPDPINVRTGFPLVFPELVSYRCRHENLKAVKMSGYVGCSTHDNFVLRLLKYAPSLETVTIDTESEYYENYGQKLWDYATMCTGPETGARTRIEAKVRAEKLKFKFPPSTVLIVT